MGKTITDYHGDDYGLSMNNAIRMIQLIDAGRLDSISIIPNMTAFTQTMDYLSLKWETFKRKPLISVHLNIADGFSLSGIDDPFFTYKAEADGKECHIFHTSWIRLFLASFVPGRRKKIRSILAKEFELQIRRVQDALPDDVNSDNGRGTKKLRLDSHTHTHMIPVVFDAMMDAVEALGLMDSLSFVRVSAEPIAPFRAIRGTCPKINLVKNILLNMLSGRAERILNSRGISYSMVWGLIMSGKMDEERVGMLLPSLSAIAADKGRELEIICHPGIVLPSEQYEEYGITDREFFRSGNRDVEYKAAMNVVR